jgi:hypothetical protein
MIVKLINFNFIFFENNWYVQKLLAVILIFIVKPSTADIYIPRKGSIFIDLLKKNIDWIILIIIFGNFDWQLKVIIIKIISKIPIVVGNLIRHIFEFLISIEYTLPRLLLFSLSVQPIKLWTRIYFF